MKARSQVSNDLFATRRAGFIRIALATTLMVVILVWISITNAVPAFATDDGDGGIIKPTMPDGSAFENTAVAFGRLVGAVLFVIAGLAFLGALYCLIRWIIYLIFGSEHGAKSSYPRRMFILLGIAGVMGGSGTAIFVAISNSLGTVFGF